MVKTVRANCITKINFPFNLNILSENFSAKRLWRNNPALRKKLTLKAFQRNP